VLVGVIVALASGHESAVSAVGQGLAVGGGIAAGLALLPRTGGAINPQALQDRYLDKAELTTRLTLLATRLDLYQADEDALRRKFRRIRIAVLLLLAAAAAVLIGSIFDLS